jgi:mRNA interferase RelE/StbE
VAINSRYLVKFHPLVNIEDVPYLPLELQQDLRDLFPTILEVDPYGCQEFPNHSLVGRLRGYRVLDIEWEGNPNAYKLVYRIYEKPAPKRVLILSFDEHDLAYEKAKIRAEKK